MCLFFGIKNIGTNSSKRLTDNLDQAWSVRADELNRFWNWWFFEANGEKRSNFKALVGLLTYPDDGWKF